MNPEELSMITSRLERFIFDKYELYFNYGVVSRDVVDLEIGWTMLLVKMRKFLCSGWLTWLILYLKTSY